MIIYGWLKANCEGCEKEYPSQLDHACLNYGAVVNMNAVYFKDCNHLIRDEWIIGAAREFLKNEIDVHSLKVTVCQVRKRWIAKPQLACEAIENSPLKKDTQEELSELTSQWLGTIDYSLFTLSNSL